MYDPHVETEQPAAKPWQDSNIAIHLKKGIYIIISS